MNGMCTVENYLSSLFVSILFHNCIFYLSMFALFMLAEYDLQGKRQNDNRLTGLVYCYIECEGGHGTYHLYEACHSVLCS